MCIDNFLNFNIIAFCLHVSRAAGKAGSVGTRGCEVVWSDHAAL